MLEPVHASALGSAGLGILLLSTAGVAVVHTLAGPDHYLPFVAMGRARRWSLRRLVFWTTLCGFGHVASSVALAVAAVIFGYGLERVQWIEDFRGNLAGWALIAFGAVYVAWGLKRALRRREHVHAHGHEDGVVHLHRHAHRAGHRHLHEPEAGFRVTPWILFTIFVLGPCEPMIPLVMYPAAQGSWMEMGIVVALFGAITIGAMLATVLLAVRGLTLLPRPSLGRFAHAAAGAVVLGAGSAIQFLGL
jgi:nickel/cobalt transporter (NicO) family protein